MKQKDLQDVLSSEAGRRAIGGIFHDCGLWEAPFCGEGSTAQAFTDGRRAVAVEIANRIREIDPMLVARCEIEHRNFELEWEEAMEPKDEEDEE
jgi:hypothetical protein